MDMNGGSKQVLWGVLGGAASVCLTLWLRFYMSDTDSFADLRDVPGILLAFFVGPFAALVSGALSSFGRAAVGFWGGIGAATWFGSSLATFCATLDGVRGSDCSTLLKRLHADVLSFVGGERQSDDITLLSVRYLGPES